MQVFASGSVNGSSPAVVGGTGTTEKIFPSLLGPGFNNGGSSLSPGSGTPVCSLVIPGSSIYEGQQMIIRASGTLYIHGTSPTLQFVLQNGTSFTSGSNTTCATLASAVSLTTATQYPWAFSVNMQGDSVSGEVQLWGGTLYVGGTSGGTMTLTSLTGISFVNGAPALNLVFGFAFAVSDGANLAKLMQFTAES